VPPVINPPRRIPIALKDRVKQVLDYMVSIGLIEPVHEPAEWVSLMVITERKTGKKLRISIDSKPLSEAIRWANYSMKTMEQVAAKLSGEAIFSSLDASLVFFQIRISPECSKLLMFNTPFGCYRYKRMPMGIKSAPEIWQRMPEETLFIADDTSLWQGPR